MFESSERYCLIQLYGTTFQIQQVEYQLNDRLQQSLVIKPTDPRQRVLFNSAFQGSSCMNSLSFEKPLTVSAMAFVVRITALVLWLLESSKFFTCGAGMLTGIDFHFVSP